MEQLGTTLWQLLLLLGQLFTEVGWLLLLWSLSIAWLAWWLGAVNWKKAWPWLASGGWAPVVLLVLMGALVWSAIAPGECNCLRFVTVPNFWWQLGGVGLLAAIALFCGWLQGVFGWYPAEVEIGPPAHAHAHAGHGHGHHEVEASHSHGHGEAAEPEHPDQPPHH